MDRRNFIGRLLAIGAGFTILPGAGRIWKVTRTVHCRFIPNPAYIDAPYEAYYWFWGADGGQRAAAFFRRYGEHPPLRVLDFKVEGYAIRFGLDYKQIQPEIFVAT